jgi:hypothetical protein
MTDPALQPDMAWHLRRLLEAVKGAAWAIEGRWRWLAAPMLLVTWVLTRRERREAAVALAAFQGLLETFLGMLDDFRAGKFAVSGVEEGAGGADGAVAYPSPSRSPGSSPGAGPALSLKGRGIQAADNEAEEGANGAVAYPSPQPSPSRPPSRGEGTEVGAVAAAENEGLIVSTAPSRANAMRTFWPCQFVARAPPRGVLEKRVRHAGTGASISLRNRNYFLSWRGSPGSCASAAWSASNRDCNSSAASCMVCASRFSS